MLVVLETTRKVVIGKKFNNNNIYPVTRQHPDEFHQADTGHLTSPNNKIAAEEEDAKQINGRITTILLKRYSKTFGRQDYWNLVIYIHYTT